ncbi:MAG: agmatine deiminase family protein, partial [Pseudomonadota bacterium]
DKSLSAISSIHNKFSPLVGKERLKIVQMPYADRGFWARDGVPVPVIRETPLGDELFTVVDAPYYHKFEADQEFADLFGAELTKHDYYYEGGNFVANSRGDCLVVNKSATAQIPDSIFEDHYGCKDLTRLAYVKGIGHADESVKYVDDDTVLTDEPSYIPQLKAKGYKVHLLPRAKKKYETYVNSLYVNGVLYVPVFGQATDAEALKVYREAGFDKIIDLNSEFLSNHGAGSIHCITMTYPPVPLEKLVSKMGGKLVQ